MKKIKIILITAITLFVSTLVVAQDLQIISHETFKYDIPGLQTDIAFHFEAVNISIDTQTVFLVRTINDLPFPEPQWTSSLCFGELCFPPDLDSVATTIAQNPPIAPNDTLYASVHVFPQSGIGTANIQVQIGTFAHPDDRTTLDFIATTDPSVSVNEEINLNDYLLAQNYPNPFNPSTKIEYRVKEAGFVSLEVYNILGVKVATPINDYKPAGKYIVDFVADDLASGVYLYKLSVNNFTQTRKMILEK
ncbi:MAG: T9SS type A sorting domain-containing protein [Ignavibacteriaceae bacterium]|nr:T9SS type A sorting domain-containing protein [Ignavibacteria bacterium]MBT8391624.1 T9SS type A sorting domain-containing protein [Ignavibacteria bacterium]NNJ53045.1 T9SS type A sorting domain-containing protein [Ignavibacteriaceae bacterium]